MFLPARFSLTVVTLIWLAGALHAQTALLPKEGQDAPPKATIIVDRQLVRFLVPQTHEWRLAVTNSQGEVIFDSGFISSPTLEWPLLNQQGAAVASGLYSYTLAFKEPTSETPRLQRGHIILDRPSQTQRIWVTGGPGASIGAGSGEIKLTVVGGAEATLGGAEFPGGAARRESSKEGTQSPQLASNEATAEKAAASVVAIDTDNRIAKFGNIGIGTIAPLEKLHVSGGTAIFDRPDGAIRVTKTAGVLSDDDLGIWNRSGGGGQPFAIADWQTGTKGIFLNTSTGNAGIGTDAPQARLDVRGDIRLGLNGQYRATSGEENLRIVRGVVVSNTGTIIRGVGFSVAVNPSDPTKLTINFSTPFASPPSVVATLDDGGGTSTATEIFTDGVTGSSFNLKLRTRYSCSACDPARGPFHFIAIGPR